MANFPTRGQKALDLFFTTNPGLTERCKPIPGVGDHDAILVDTAIKPRRTKPTPRTIFLWDKADRNELKDEDVILPTIKELGNYSHRQLAELYHRYINTVQVLCHRIVRIGNLEDGGWEICEDKQFRPTPPCLVYSFGINNDFSFDDHIAERYNCEVHSFDPSMEMKDGQRKPKQWFHNIGLSDRSETLSNGWRVGTLQELMNMQQHSGTKIDILKIDVEKYEWVSLLQIFESGGLKNIRQLVIELHSAIVGEPSEHEYRLALGILKHLYDAGFRIVYTHRNLWCKFLSQFEGIEEVGCHEVSFVYIS